MKIFVVEFKESNRGWHLEKSNYLPPIPANIYTFISPKKLPKFTEDCLYNFDKNMTFFKSLSNEDFQKTTEKFLKKYPQFKKIDDLNLTRDKSGYYLMVLDKYKQVYIGTTDTSIFTRIKHHMVSNKEYYKLLWGPKDESKLSIDAFRPLDITRIYAYFTKKTYVYEDKFIQEFPERYLLNRICGGETDGLLEAFSKNIEHKI